MNLPAILCFWLSGFGFGILFARLVWPRSTKEESFIPPRSTKEDHG